MSQEKIDRYKEEKANRKKNIAKQKRNALLAKIGGVVVILALIVYIGFSAYRTDKAEKEAASANAQLMSILESMNEAAKSTTTGEGTTTKGEGATTTSKDETTADGETTKAGESETTTVAEDETTTSAE